MKPSTSLATIAALSLIACSASSSDEDLTTLTPGASARTTDHDASIPGSGQKSEGNDDASSPPPRRMTEVPDGALIAVPDARPDDASLPVDSAPPPDAQVPPPTVTCAADELSVNGHCAVNLARSASVSQSSTYTPGGCNRAADRARDGAVCSMVSAAPIQTGYDTTHLSSPADQALCSSYGCSSIQHTNEGEGEYWQADLGATHTVGRVLIWPWHPGSYRILTGNDGVNWTSTDFVPPTITLFSPYDISVNSQARYVRVMRVYPCVSGCAVATQEIEIFGF